MLKFTYLVQLGLLGTLALPAIDLQSGSLEQALAETERALAEIVQRAPKGAETPGYDAVEHALRASEPTIGDARERDAMLEHLTQDVGRLQQELDELEVHGYMPPAAETATVAGPAPRTGLDDAQRDALAHTRPGAKNTDPAQAVALEDEGYSADPVRHGRACFRAGRFAEGLALLAAVQNSPAADYWRARCLERLGRIDEALRAYEAVVAAEPASELGLRAARDLDFVAWHQAFEERLAARRTP